MARDPGRLDGLATKAPLFFLLGGLFYGVGTVGLIVTTYTGTSFGADTTFAALGKVLVPLGLLGLYPALVEGRPYLSRAAAAVAVVPIACWGLAFVAEVLLKPTGIVSEAPGPLALAPFVGFLTLYLAFALFGVATLLEDVHPRSVVALLLVYPAMFPVWMTVLSGAPEYASGVFAVVVYAAIGVSLWTAEGTPADAEVAAGPTA